jgi:hypothetical protein
VVGPWHGRGQEFNSPKLHKDLTCVGGRRSAITV